MQNKITQSQYQRTLLEGLWEGWHLQNVTIQNSIFVEGMKIFIKILVASILLLVAKQRQMLPVIGLQFSNLGTCFLAKKEFSPDWCGSIGWASFCKAKSCQFDCRSGHMPGLWVWSQSGYIGEATNRCFSLTSMFLSLSFSLPSPLSKNK